METKKRVYRAYLIEITENNTRTKKLVSNKMKAVNEIHRYLKEKYKDYEENDYWKYQTFALKVDGSKSKGIERQIKDSLIKVTKYELT